MWMSLLRAVVFASALPAVLLPDVAAAQNAQPAAPDLKKWDAVGTIGWYHREIDQGLYQGGRSALFAGASLGRYWTEHLKTEFEVASGGRIDNVYYWDPSLASSPYNWPAIGSVSDFQVSAAQFYQFFHNAWVHPFVGGGAVFERDRHHAARPAQQATVYSYPNGKTTTQTISIPGWSRDWTTSTVTPFVLTGFKTYLSSHAFFRADLRVAGTNRVRSVNSRIGFGVDF